MSKSEMNDEYALIADYYDYVIPYRNRGDISFYVRTADESGGPVLELGCGSGRVLLPIARSGIDIVGLDISPHMLAVCRDKLTSESVEVQSRVQLIEGDMKNFELSGKFRLITTPFRSFQHLITIEDQIACLRCIHRHLAKDGRLILDLFDPSLEILTSKNLGEEFGDEPEFTMPDDRRVLRRARNTTRDLPNQVIDAELIYYVTHPDGRRERLVHSFPMRYLFRYEAQHLLCRCGFEIENTYADFDKSSYGSKYPGEIILVAVKAEEK
jgi:SAM-dependent methyltransferase